MELVAKQLAVRGQKLCVGVLIKTSAWDRFAVVQVPLTDLLRVDITDALDRAVRARLRETWDPLNAEQELPLDG